MNIWERAGYTKHAHDTRVRDSFGPDFEPVEVGRLREPNDYCWIGCAWVSMQQFKNLIGMRINTDDALHIRPKACAPPAHWYCNSPQCLNRENDRGHACYWCGAKQKTAPVRLLFYRD